MNAGEDVEDVIVGDPDVDDADPDPLVADPEPVDDDPEVDPPPPGSPVIDGVTVKVAVGYMVVVITVLVIMVVGPKKLIMFPSP